MVKLQQQLNSQPVINDHKRQRSEYDEAGQSKRCLQSVLHSSHSQVRPVLPKHQKIHLSSPTGHIIIMTVIQAMEMTEDSFWIKRSSTVLQITISH